MTVIASDLISGNGTYLSTVKISPQSTEEDYNISLLCLRRQSVCLAKFIVLGRSPTF
jgi:hypothetical protein